MWWLCSIGIVFTDGETVTKCNCRYFSAELLFNGQQPFFHISVENAPLISLSPVDLSFLNFFLLISHHSSNRSSTF